ncbi:TetR/AcrR family transcriptional regulator C-terminal domain-containing protein [Janibacter sp. DB-40]|uniref:TetR/AcrR family transcriptional regulator C-terminal domain-containing protein n=1 Tax=Janibacter sp. DB-40 TaxID=3028808 RepID=UPI002406779D|nr:TetR/AcrR family transcriptional regulator C-terminal domain-containing protein [Janibacter sp. DB-40]
MPDAHTPRSRPLTRALLVDTALAILARAGLPDLTMRAIGTELGVRQSALYHHVDNKQALLGAVADEIIARGPRGPAGVGDDWRRRARRRCADLHAAVTAYPDGADLVMSMWAFGMGAQAPFVELRDLLTEAGLSTEVAPTAARTLLHFVYGHAYDEQSHEHAARSGITPGERAPTDFDTGLDIVLTGISALPGLTDDRPRTARPGR